MCGIVAQFTKDLQPPDKNRIRAMAGDIRHRGPDDEGFYFGEWFGLGFRRLSILDLSQAGHQPMFDEKRRYVIVYNGELYNCGQIRQDLIGRGYSFFSGSDTEVVLKAFMEWGTGCLTKFTGMFAFIIIDLVGEKVCVARDQLGIKPIYLYEDKKHILFASEIKCFRRFIDFELNRPALYEQFLYKYVGGRQTIFRDIYRLEPGTYMEFDRSGTIREKKYYDVTAGLLAPRRTAVDLEAVEAELKASIFAHTQSDVGYNIQLSGGVDSSYITAVLAGDYKQDLHTFSVAMNGYSKDESAQQNFVAGHFNTSHHSFHFDGKSLADIFPKATWQMDMPVSHTNCPFLMLLCGHSRDHSKVILTGEAADELFGGYARYNIPFPDSLAYSLQRRGVRPWMLPPVWKLKTLRSLLSRDIGTDEQADFPEDRIRQLFSGLDKRNYYRLQVTGKFGDLMGKIRAHDQTVYLSSLLERQDRMSMAMSVESRVPFCTPALFDLVNSFSPDDRAARTPKYILKKLSEKYFGRDFVYRKKIGFTLPVVLWLKDKKNLGRYLDLLTDDTFRQRGFYNADAVSRSVDDLLNNGNGSFKDLWSIIRFEIWHRVFIDKTL
ncbi:MAG: asparagine synthase (glutamine-hydrolyzing) [Nitrospirae bacterium]|nr:asparagine synthase (glutamine-hydrolyzing) [Nitrospirota bacterium]